MSIDVVGALTAAYEIVGPKLLKQCGYIVFCNSHANDLKREIKSLKDASDRLQHKVDLAESVGDIIEQDVWTWLTTADQELIKSTSLILQKNSVSCCFGFVPNPKARYVLGRGALKSLPELRDLIERGKFDQVSYHPAAELASEVKVRSATTSSSTVRYVELKSRALVLKRIMADLNQHNKIGVYGMGGVGKTTLLKDVEKRARESGKFDDVITVFVSQAPNIDDIKSKVRNKLGRLGSNEDEANKKTLLILLDDLWSKLKGVDSLEKSSNVKVKWVMTSRKQELLAEGMDCCPTISLDVLEEEEGWELFGKLVNNDKVEDMKKNPAIVALLKKCARLPVSIEALANVLEKKGLSSSDLVMEDVLKLGKESINGSSSLELSYNYLEDTDLGNLARSLFRIIGLLGSPTVPILTLLKYTIGFGLIGGNRNSSDNNIMERARRQVSTSLRMLQDASLLLESDDSDYVKIHDIVRDVAASIASRDDCALIFNREDGLKLNGWSKEKMKKSTSVYLPYSVIPKLNEGWECPELSIFIMEAGPAQGGQVISSQKKRRSHVKLPSSFYKGMAKLKIVDLRNVRLTSLPSSIQSDLRNLTTLFFHFCCIENVSIIGQLKSLQILSFVGSDLAHLPKEIGGLTKLRILDLSKCSDLKTIEPGTLKKLTRLEELYIKESFDMWEVEGAEQPSNSSLAELNSLPRLRTLEVCVPDTNTLPLKLPLGDLVRYKVLIGDSWDWSGEYSESRTLKFKDNSKNILNEDWLQSVLQTTQHLFIDGLSGARGSFHAQCKERFKELKHLHLQNSSSIQYIIWSTEWLDCRAFTVLESMILEKMDSLEKICHGLINSTSFSKLKVVRVQECHKLLSLFNLSLVNSLAELEEIEVSDCKVVREIVTAEEMDDNDGTDTEDHKKGCPNNLFGCPIKRSKGKARAPYVIKLGNLRCLTLRNLPKLRTFFGNEALSESMQTTGHVLLNEHLTQALQSCKPKKFMPASRYKEIPPNTHLELDKLQRLELMDCKNIVHFLSSSMLFKLLKLESLTIARCESLEDIFDLNGVDAKIGDVEILPMLSELKLRELPKLEHIWMKNDMQIKGCRSLRTIEIYQCSSLLYVSSSSICEAMDNLTEINVVHCKMMKTVFLEKRGLSKSVSRVIIGLRSLKNLVISDCPNLKVFLSVNRQTISPGVAMGLNVASSTTLNGNNKEIPYWCCGKQADDLVDTSSFFNQKVFLPELESVIFSSAGEFEKLWCNEAPTAKSYCNLELVHVEYCHNLLTVIPVALIERLQKLKHLVVKDCEKLETVINFVVDWETKKKPKALMLPQLQELKLESLDSLRRIIETDSDDDKIVVGFPNLKRVIVLRCKVLTHLIPASTATTLLKLEHLDIFKSALKEVVYGEVSERNKMNDVITFPHLTSLSMSDLDNLICFCSERYSLDFPCLKVLWIGRCENLKMLVKPRPDGHLGSQDEDRSSTATQAFFNDKVRLPNLERFSIVTSKVEQLWGEEPPMGSFCKLQLLNIYECLGLGNIIPLFLVNRLQNLESTYIDGCGSLEDMFKMTSTEPILSVDDLRDAVEGRHVVEESIKEEGRHATERIVVSLTKLTTLDLGSDIKFDNLLSGRYILELPNLKKLIFRKTTTTTAILEKVHFPNIEELQISSNAEICELWHGEPPIGSFCKLKFLRVSRCQQLKKVIPFFMLGRLQNLEELEVHNCDNLETVCELDNKQDVGETSDSELHCLSLFRNLTSVCVKNCKSLINLFSLLGTQHRDDEDGNGTFVDDSTTNNKRIVVSKLNKLRLEDLPNFRHLFHDVLQLHGDQYTLELPSLKDFFLIGTGSNKAVTQKVVFPKKLEIREHEDITFFGSTSRVLKEIMEALLSNQNYQSIGLHGSLGSYLVVELERQVKEEADLFDEVVMPPRDNDAKSIQEVLGRKLGIIYGMSEEQGIRAQILQKSLLSKGLHKRLLFLLNVSKTIDLEAVGIPRKGLDPRLFKQIFICKDREVLVKMGAQQVIDIGESTGDRCHMLEDLSKCDSKMAFPKQELQVDTPRNDISLFNVGSKTTYDLFGSIMEHLETHQSDQIIGILGSYHKKLFMTVALELKLATLLDIVYLRGNNDADKIQERLGRRLGITYSERSEITERAHHLRESLLSNKDKSLLLLASDLVEGVNLEAFGIPRAGELDPKLFKIILVSEKREVLDQMGAQHVIDIGDTSHLWLSDRLADESGCDQLVELLAKKLKGKGLPAWEKALQRLQDSPFEYEARKKVVDSLFVSDEDSEESLGIRPLVITRQAKAGTSNLL